MTTRIFIVEDELIHFTDLSILLEEAGYEMVGTTDNADDAFDKIKDTQPDVVLVDISLPGINNGITLSERINKELNIPHIFTTSLTQDEVIEQAVNTNPAGYLKKPVELSNLKAAIQIALSRQPKPTQTPEHNKSLLFTKVGDKLVKIPIDEIRFAQADADKYISIFLENKELACRISLKELLNQLPASFMQIHRSVVINLDYLYEINEKNQTVNMLGHELSIGRKYRKELNNRLKKI